MVIDIDLPTLSDLMLQRPLDPGAEPVGPALGVSAVEPGLLDAALRLVRLLDTPAAAPPYKDALRLRGSPDFALVA